MTLDVKYRYTCETQAELSSDLLTLSCEKLKLQTMKAM